MLNKRIRKKYSSCLFWLLLSMPLIGAAASPEKSPETASKQTGQNLPTLPELIHDSSEHFSGIESADLDGLLERIADSRVVLIGEASHGTAEFYEMRARITRELIEKKGFNIVALEADWPDASVIDHFIRGTRHRPVYRGDPFSGYPSWMWANHSVLAFTQWLRNYNQFLNPAADSRTFEDKVGFYGLDFYNIFASIDAVVDYLQAVDPQAAAVARWRYGCLMPWVNDPSLYSRAMKSGRYGDCGDQVSAVLQALLKKRVRYIHTGIQANRHADKQRYFNAEQNARLVMSGEYYYRTMYEQNNTSWNQRDQSMFDTLLRVMNYRGQNSKAIVWAHNSHIGDSRATQRSEHGEVNLGQMARETFADNAYLIGFGTDHGTVAAASEWGGEMKTMQVQPSHADSYERLCHDVKTDNFLLPLRRSVLRTPEQEITRQRLLTKRLQRAIGTTYDPEDELKKHYIYASLPRQFDEYIWLDETHAVKPLRETLNAILDPAR